MLDTTTYLATQDNPGGPILRLADQQPHEPCEISVTAAEPTSLGQLIGRAISIAILAATAVYLCFAV